MKYLAAILLILALTKSWADTNNADTLKQHQKQLQALLTEINQITKQRNQHKATLEKLEQQLQCNWKLIQDYDLCKKLHKKIPVEHLNCTIKAKQDAIKCMK